MISEFFDVEVTSYESERDRFISHMNALRDMTNEELTLYKKWKEVQEYRKDLLRSESVRKKIFHLTDASNAEQSIAELQALKPVLVYVDPTDSDLMSDWLMLRVFTHTMSFDQNPGRFIRFLAVDTHTGKYIGCVSLGSDVISITSRDKWIGWTKEDKLVHGRLNHSAIATCITSVQPFAYNFLGGKLVASLLTTPVVRDTWKKLYGETLVGITTTSLYGSHSMYQRIPFWKELDETTGKITLKPDDSYYEFWHHFIKDKYPDAYKNTVGSRGRAPATGAKQKILVMIMRELKMVQSHYAHGFKRGVYYTELYSNAREFLCRKIDESQLTLNPKIADGVQSVLRWWLPKAINRYTTLHHEQRLATTPLYYNDLIDMSWEDCKSKYLQDVGR